jgi:uncharacterized repeat protein (TIGR03803 family)
MKTHTSQLWTVFHSSLLLVGSCVAAFTPSAQASTLTAVHMFSSSTSPGKASLVLGDDGNYYGVTRAGGASYSGSFYRLTPSGTFTELMHWSGSDGAYPDSLIKGSDGNLYGTTEGGGYYGFGTVFQLLTDGTLTVLMEFSGGSDGYHPDNLVQGSSGEFYGTTEGGGDYGDGSVFELDDFYYSWALTTLRSFDASVTGRLPNSLIYASDGNLYGTTYVGGTYNSGTVYCLDPWGHIVVLEQLGQYAFYDGANPMCIMEKEPGKFIGLTSGGGSYGRGLVFTYTEDLGYVTWIDFSTGEDTGWMPFSAPILAGDGSLYGTMSMGGYSPSDVDGGGTLYRMEFDFSNYNYDFTALANFNSSGPIGAAPLAGLMDDGAGHFYGTTSSTSGGYPKIFKFTP